jgi:hypothetical protein
MEEEEQQQQRGGAARGRRAVCRDAAAAASRDNEIAKKLLHAIYYNMQITKHKIGSKIPEVAQYQQMT